MHKGRGGMPRCSGANETHQKTSNCSARRIGTVSLQTTTNIIRKLREYMVHKTSYPNFRITGTQEGKLVISYLY